jgi:hypothetical protein
MSTVVALPGKFEPECQIVINDRDHDVVLGNAVILLLAFNFPGGEASEFIVHFWYSAALPPRKYWERIFFLKSDHPYTAKATFQFLPKNRYGVIADVWFI